MARSLGHQARVRLSVQRGKATAFVGDGAKCRLEQLVLAIGDTPPSLRASPSGQGRRERLRKEKWPEVLLGLAVSTETPLRLSPVTGLLPPPFHLRITQPSYIRWT
jgi:hypothetical protein